MIEIAHELPHLFQRFFAFSRFQPARFENYLLVCRILERVLPVQFRVNSSEIQQRHRGETPARGTIMFSFSEIFAKNIFWSQIQS